MDNIREKKKIKLSIILLIVVIIISTIGVTLALSINKKTKVNIATGTYNVIITGNTTITPSSLMPINNTSDTIPYDNLSTYQNSIYVSSFTVKGAKANPTDHEIIYDIALINQNIDTNLLNKYLKWELIKNKEIIAHGNFSNLVNGSRYLLTTTQQDLPRYEKTADSLQLVIWINDDFDSSFDQTTMMGKNFSSTIDIELYTDSKGSSVPNSGLYQLIEKQAVRDDIKSTYVTSTNGIDFGSVSSSRNGEGVYLLHTTASNQYPIYYYRGAVTNNNVLFGGFCWKIIRTTDTGGIKMIYNGTPSNNQCTNTTGEATQIGTSAFNRNSSPADVGYMYGTRYVSSLKGMSSVTDTYVYGNDVTYSNGTYTLKDTMTSSSWSTDRTTLATKYHYTCLSTSATCSSVRYIHTFRDSSMLYYLTLTGGDNIESAKTKMFTNTTDSKIKTTIDNWYKTNMTSYTDKLEDTVYCNDRTITEGPLLSKDTSSTDINYFAGETRADTYKPSLDCSNSNDAFTVDSSIGNGKLTYPVGLITIDEVMYAGGRDLRQNSTYYLYTNQKWWLGSPDSFYNFQPYAWFVDSSGSLSSIGALYNNYGVRPVVSLAPSIEISSGSGTSTDPYIVK